MKKIMIALFIVAATFNAMAINYTAKAKLTLTSTSNNKSCTLTIAESEDFGAGLNPGYYAELNTEGKEVWFYVVYNNVKYQQFGSNAATMQGLQLGIKTNASETYTLTASNVVGTPHIMINGVYYTVTAGMSESITLNANSTLPAAGDEDKYSVQPLAPSTPAEPSICFNYNILEVKGHAGETLMIEQDGVAVVNVSSLASDNESFDLNNYQGRLVVTLNGEEYHIDANPVVTPVEP